MSYHQGGHDTRYGRAYAAGAYGGGDRQGTGRTQLHSDGGRYSEERDRGERHDAGVKRQDSVDDRPAVCSVNDLSNLKKKTLGLVALIAQLEKKQPPDVQDKLPQLQPSSSVSVYLHENSGVVESEGRQGGEDTRRFEKKVEELMKEVGCKEALLQERENECTKLKRDVEAMKKQWDNMDGYVPVATHETLQRKLKAELEQNDELLAELKKAKRGGHARSGMMERRGREQEEDVESLRETLRRKESTIRILEDRLISMGEECASLQKKNKLLVSERAQNDSAEELKAAQLQAESEKQRADRYKETAKSRKEELTAMGEKLEEANRKVRRLERSLEKKQTEHEEQRDRQQRKVDELQRRLEEKEAECQSKPAADSRESSKAEGEVDGRIKQEKREGRGVKKTQIEETTVEEEQAAESQSAVQRSEGAKGETGGVETEDKRETEAIVEKENRGRVKTTEERSASKEQDRERRKGLEESLQAREGRSASRDQRRGRERGREESEGKTGEGNSASRDQRREKEGVAMGNVVKSREERSALRDQRRERQGETEESEGKTGEGRTVSKDERRETEKQIGREGKEGKSDSPTVPRTSKRTRRPRGKQADTDGSDEDSDSDSPAGGRATRRGRAIEPSTSRGPKGDTSDSDNESEQGEV